MLPASAPQTRSDQSVTERPLFPALFWYLQDKLNHRVKYQKEIAAECSGFSDEKRLFLTFRLDCCLNLLYPQSCYFPFLKVAHSFNHFYAGRYHFFVNSDQTGLTATAVKSTLSTKKKKRKWWFLHQRLMCSSKINISEATLSKRSVFFFSYVKNPHAVT